jgi:hypothetical protein
LRHPIPSKALGLGSACCTALLALACPVLPANGATSWDLATGFDYSTGKYGGASNTSIVSIPFGARLQTDRMRFEFTIPYLRVHGPGSFASGVVVGGNNAITTQTGIGDATVGAAWILSHDGGFLPGIELYGTVKVPTAPSTLGTGKFDYSIAANLNHNISPRVMLFGSLGYQWLSDYRGINLENGVTGYGGMNYHSSDSTDIGFSANFRETYYSPLENQASLTPYVLWTFARHWRLSGYGLVGFTNSSPSVGGGARLIFFQQ